MRLIKETTNFDFLSRSRRRIALAISALAIAVSLISIGTRGLDLDLIEARVGQQAANFVEIGSLRITNLKQHTAREVDTQLQPASAD